LKQVTDKDVAIIILNWNAYDDTFKCEKVNTWDKVIPLAVVQRWSIYPLNQWYRADRHSPLCLWIVKSASRGVLSIHTIWRYRTF